MYDASRRVVTAAANAFGVTVTVASCGSTNEMGGVDGVNDLLPFVVIGLTAGSIYGLAGTGLVLTYKTSGVFNFAYGAIAAVAAFVMYWLWQREGVDWRIAAAISVLVLGPLMGLLLELLTRMLARVSTEFQVVGMVGLALGINGALILWSSSWGDITFGALQFPAYLATDTFTVGDVNIGYDQAITMGIALLATDPPLPLLPVRAARCRDARGGRQPRPGERHRHQPDRGAAVGVDHRHRVRRAVGCAHRADHGSQLAPAHPPRRPGVRRRRGRLLLQPAAHLHRRPRDRHRRVGVDEVRGHDHVAGRFPRQPAVHRAVHRVAGHAEAPARAAAHTPAATAPQPVQRAPGGEHRVRDRRASRCSRSCPTWSATTCPTGPSAC